MRMASAFGAGFSMREAVSRVGSQWGIDSSNLAAAGGIGGGSGWGGGYASSEVSIMQRSETMSFRVGSAGDGGFDEAQFISSLRAEIEKEIISNSAKIAEGVSNSDGFLFKYIEEGVEGRIDVSISIRVGHCSVRTNIEERSAAGKQLLPVNEFQAKRPSGNYHVVAFTRDHPLAEGNKFHTIGVELIRQSKERIPRGITKEQIGQLQYVEVFSLFRMPPEVKPLLQERGFDWPVEYEEYEKVYFLNDLALKMYSDAGVKLDVLRVVSADEMPEQSHRTLGGPYIPV